jgi:hypothetical protein
MFMSSFVNFALFYDGAMLFALFKAGYGDYWITFVVVLLATELVKSLPHLLREPRDWWMWLLVGVPFGYVHSFYKLWAFCTMANIEWSGRQGISATSR